MDRSANAERLKSLARQGRDGLVRRLARSFGAQGLFLGSRVLEQLVMVPIFVSAWGATLYEDWLVLMAAAGFLVALDFGMQVYFANQMQRAWSRGDGGSFERHLFTGLGLYLLVLTAATAALLASTPFIDWPALLHVTVLPSGQAFWTLVFLALAQLIFIPRGIVSAIYRARGEFDRGVNQNTTLQLSKVAGIALSLWLGAEPQVVAGVVLAIHIIVGWTVLIGDQRRRYPGLRFGVRLPDAAEAREIARTSPQYMIVSVATVLGVSAPILILNELATTAGAVVLFALSRTLAGIVRQVIHQMAHSVGVEMSRQFAQEDLERLRRLFVDVARMLSALGGLLAGSVMVVADPFMTIWSRGEVQFDPLLFALLLAAFLLVSPAQLALTLLYYVNMPRPIALANLANGAIGLVLCILLVPSLGAVGAAAGLAVAEFLTIGLYLPWVACRLVGLGESRLLVQSFSYAAAAAVGSYAVAWLLLEVMQPVGLAGLFGLGVAWAAVMALPVYHLLLTREQRAQVASYLGSRRTDR